MDKLSKITDVLLAYAKGVDLTSIPRVYLNFLHSPTDIPGENTWTLEVRLTTMDKEHKDSQVFPQSLEHRFSSSALDRESCIDGVLKELNDFLTEEIAKKMSEQEALETSMNLLLVDSTLEEVLQEDPAAMELADQEQDEIQGQPSSLIILAR
jgi:hypothetical protein